RADRAEERHELGPACVARGRDGAEHDLGRALVECRVEVGEERLELAVRSRSTRGVDSREEHLSQVQSHGGAPSRSDHLPALAPLAFARPAAAFWSNSPLTRFSISLSGTPQASEAVLSADPIRSASGP